MQKGTILLVDGDLDMLLIGQRIFGRARYKFISARNGREGLEKLVSNKPDIIISEFILPDIDGKQFMETIAQDKDYADLRYVPIVILTTRSDYIEDFDAFYKLGLRAYLTKPFGHRELVSIVENLIWLSQSEKKLRLEMQKQNQEELQARTVRPGDSIEVFLDNVHNDVGTISGLCHSILTSDSDVISDRQKIHLTAIQNSSRKLMRLVKKMTG